MKRLTLTFTVALAAALGLGSCTASGGDTFLVATKTVSATGTKAADGSVSCSYDPGANEDLGPIFNPAFGLRHGIVIENRLTANLIAGHLENNYFVAETAVMSYDIVDGTSTTPLANFTSPAQGFVPTGNKSVIDVYHLIPAGVVGAGINKVRVHVYIQGRLGDGSSVRSSDYELIAQATPALQGDGSCVVK